VGDDWDGTIPAIVECAAATACHHSLGLADSGIFAAETTTTSAATPVNECLHPGLVTLAGCASAVLDKRATHSETIDCLGAGSGPGSCTSIKRPHPSVQERRDCLLRRGLGAIAADGPDRDDCRPLLRCRPVGEFWSDGQGRQRRCASRRTRAKWRRKDWYTLHRAHGVISSYPLGRTAGCDVLALVGPAQTIRNIESRESSSRS